MNQNFKLPHFQRYPYLHLLFQIHRHHPIHIHYLAQRLMESFIFPILDHASPTQVIIRTLRWLSFTLPSTYCSRFLSKWSSDKERTSSLNGLFINTSTTWTWDVHLGGTLTSKILCFFKNSFTLWICCTQWTSGIGMFSSEFWSIGFLKGFTCSDRNPFLHNLLITPSIFLMHDLHSSVITLFFFSTYSKTFALKNNSWSYCVNPIRKYCQLDSRFSLV